jgi:anti-anti-sigma regulatory factor
MSPDDRHPTGDELADLALGVFEDREAAAFKAHLAGCTPCAQVFSQLIDLPELLASIWFPPMPERLPLRIEAALAMEARQRADLASGRGPAWRREGVVDSAAGLRLSDHLCWAYRGIADWADRAVEYSADGIAAGQRVVFIGDASTAGLRSELAELVSSMPVSRAANAGTAGIGDLADRVVRTSDGDVDPDTSLAARLAAVDQALAAGYTGLRTVVDATAAVRTEAKRDAAARLEYLGDRRLHTLPACSMCGYDLEVIGPTAVAELACMHPLISPGAAPFRLYAEHDADFGLAGTIDDATAGALFRATLERTDPPAGNELIVDARRAELIGDCALEELDAHAARMGRTAVLRTSTSNSPSRASLSSLTSLTVVTGDCS